MLAGPDAGASVTKGYRRVHSESESSHIVFVTEHLISLSSHILILFKSHNKIFIHPFPPADLGSTAGAELFF